MIRIYAHDVTARKRAEMAIHELARRLVTAQEEERQRVSRELHDEAGQALTALKISLQLLQDSLPLETETLQSNLAEAVALTDVTRDRIRLLAQGLRPPALDTVGINRTLEDFCREFARHTHLDIRYHGVNLPDMPDAVSIGLYRLIQEALTNAAKHAQADKVTVRIERRDAAIAAFISDDGRGFDVDSGRNSLDRPAGIGLMGMRERFELLGGKLEIRSEPGKGTHLAVHLPLEEEA